MKSPIASVLLMVTLAACGGGGSSSPPLLDGDPAQVAVRQASVNEAFRLPGEPVYGASCAAATGPFAVMETDNVRAYNGSTVATQAELTAFAQAGDAAVRTLRQRFGLAATVGLDGRRVRLCLDDSAGGGAGVTSLIVGRGATGLNAVVLHEMAHVMQAQALGCQTQSTAHERWLLEGMALRVAEQDQPSRSDLGGLQATFAAGTTPMHDISSRGLPSFNRYPGYRLAVDTLLGETKRTDTDLLRFLQRVGQQRGCPSQGGGDWKLDFDAFFGTDLRGSGAMGSGFWAAATPYGRP